MASREDLIQALIDSLKETDEFHKLEAGLKVELLKILSGSQPEKKPELPAEIKFVNKLITEYLLWVGYKNTASILVTESGMSQTPVNSWKRSSLLKELNLKDDGQSDTLPILLNLVSTFQKISESSM